MKKKDNIDGLPIILSSSALTELLNISRETLSNWQQHVSFPKDAKVKHGFYDLQKIIEFRDTYIYGDAEIAKEIQKEKLKYQQARSERERLEMEELKGLLVRKEDFKKKLTEVIVIVKDALLLLPKTLPPTIGVDFATQKKVTFALDSEIKRILRIWASGTEATQNFVKENKKK